jgi:hypothetical protein
MATSTPTQHHHHNDSNCKNQHMTREQQEYEERRKQRVKDEVFRKHQIEYRRNTVFSLSSQGLNQYEIAKILHVTQPLICQDMHILEHSLDRHLNIT